MEGRKVFNHLHVELSVLAGKNISRMHLWEAVSNYGDPRLLTKESALRFLEAEGYGYLRELRLAPGNDGFDRMLASFKKHDFTIESPEEILERFNEDWH